MPFLNLVHLRDLACGVCGALLAPAGSRSFIVDERGEPYAFSADNVPEAMRVRLRCANGHASELGVPRDVGAEGALMTPDDAPIGADAIMLAQGEP